MKKIIALSLALLSWTGTHASTSVGVSIGINQPGMYGRIDIGNYPQPALVYDQPVIIVPGRVVERRPIYLYVPEPHQRNWPRYCVRYQACGQPVYFVQERWVRERYEQERAYRGEDDRDERHDQGRHKGRGHGHRD